MEIEYVLYDVQHGALKTDSVNITPLIRQAPETGCLAFDKIVLETWYLIISERSGRNVIFLCLQISTIWRGKGNS
jgi:hypothetical protein